MDVTVSLRSPAVRYFAAVARSPDTCRHSSRVGTTTSARGIPLSGRSASVVMRCSSGTPKAQGLAHAGARLTDEVVARERERQGQFLDSKGMFLAVFGQCAHDFVANSEFGKLWVEVGHASGDVAFQCHFSWRPRAHEFDEATAGALR